MNEEIQNLISPIILEMTVPINEPLTVSINYLLKK